MSDAKTLAAKATARPWRAGDRGERDLGGFWTIHGPEWKLGEIWSEQADAALIVYAVNRIEQAEADLAEALALLVEMDAAYSDGRPRGDMRLIDAIASARAFLAAHGAGEGRE